MRQRLRFAWVLPLVPLLVLGCGAHDGSGKKTAALDDTCTHTAEVYVDGLWSMSICSGSDLSPAGGGVRPEEWPESIGPDYLMEAIYRSIFGAGRVTFTYDTNGWIETINVHPRAGSTLSDALSQAIRDVSAFKRDVEDTINSAAQTAYDTAIAIGDAIDTAKEKAHAASEKVSGVLNRAIGIANGIDAFSRCRAGGGGLFDCIDRARRVGSRRFKLTDGTADGTLDTSQGEYLLAVLLRLYPTELKAALLAEDWPALLALVQRAATTTLPVCYGLSYEEACGVYGDHCGSITDRCGVEHVCGLPCEEPPPPCSGADCPPPPTACPPGWDVCPEEGCVKAGTPCGVSGG